MRTLRRQKCAYALCLVLCLVGLSVISIAIWKTWEEASSAENPLSAFWSLLWTERLDLIPSIEFKLAYLVILGFAMLFTAVGIWALSRQWFYLPGETVLVQCSFCKKKWTASGDKGLVHCPHCRQLIHPKITEK